MTAHPKRDPATGELHFFGYGFFALYLTYHRLSATGTLVESRVVDVPGPTMVHDFAVTENHVVWLDLPVVFDAGMLGRGMPFRWEDSYGARIGVMDRAGRVTWFDVDPCYVFHVGNAREDAGAAEAGGAGHSRELGARPGEAIFVPASGATSEDDGWLLSIVTDHAGDGSHLLVLDASSLDSVASVRLPRRVPAGFHGSWLPDHGAMVSAP
ncbi:hypothetical protein GCM10023075_72520 [Streptosporangium album]